MTDKEIIIDGVNVAGCRHIYTSIYNTTIFCSATDKRNDITGEYYFSEWNKFICKNNPNCSYKQLQRKEQTIEKIEKVIAPYQEPFELDALSLPTAIESILDRLQAENETLKQYKASKQVSYEAMQQKCNDVENKNRKLQGENEELKQWQEDAENILKTQLDNFDKVENRYKQALKKIEEIAKPFASSNPIYNCWSLLLKCSCCSEKKECTKENPFKQMRNILNLINEVQDAD